MKLYCFLLLMALPILGHPHMFIDTHASIVMDQKGVKGVELEWIFDDMFSSVVIKEYDKDQNKKFSAAEVKKIQKEAFSYTAEHNYFTKLIQNKKVIPIGKPQNFTPTIEQEKLVYRFFIPCAVPVKQSSDLKLSVFDPTFYISFEFPKKGAITFKNNQHFTTSVTEHDPSAKKLFVAPTTSLEFIIKLKRKLKQL